MSTTTSTERRPSERGLRRDAAENRQLLLTAAASVFSEHGLESSVEEIARVAGVGIGTLYRRFPNKEALITELVHDMLETMSTLAAEAAGQPAGRGLEQFLESSSAYQAEHRGCLPRLWNTDPGDDALRHVRRSIRGLLEDAKRHGRVREELTATDLTMIMWSVRGVIETTRGIAPGVWRRHLDILLAGMRPATDPLRHRPLTQAQVDHVIATPQ
jgi:AcrR family transcriptional regulator